MGSPTGATPRRLERDNDFDNWLFQHQTPDCNNHLSYDGETMPNEPLARGLMVGFWVLALVAVWLMPRRDESEAAHDELTALDGSARIQAPRTRRERWLMLDAARIVGVLCVLAEHMGGHEYSESNTAFTSQWVLQWLFVTSGISFFMSRSSFVSFFARYGAVFLAGFVLNMLGDIISKPHWWNDFGNTVYQMFYVLATMILALFAWPLRSCLRNAADPFGSTRAADCFCVPDRLGCLLLYSSLWLTAVVAYVADIDLDGLVDKIASGSSWGGYVSDVVVNVLYFAAHILGLPTLIATHIYLRRGASGWMTWLAMAYIYLPVVVFPTKQAFGPHDINLYILGMLSQAYPFAGAATIARYARAYWILLLALMLFLTMPTLHGRCDLYPPQTGWERSRWYGVEAILQLLLLTRALYVDDPAGILDALGWWALWAFCSHVFFARTIESPWGFVIEVLLMPVFVVGFRHYDRWLGREPREIPVGRGVAAETSSAAAKASPLVSEHPYGTFGESKDP